MRYFIGFLVTIGLIIILIIMLLGGGGDDKANVPATKKALYDYANTDAEVTFIADGPINYDGAHKQVKIIVGANSIQYNQINGYNGQVTKGMSFPNNEAAYRNFLKALANQGYSLGDTSPELRDEQGKCPAGNRYIYKLDQGGKELQRFWTTSCSGPKSFEGKPAAVNTLFKAQVPDYSRLSSGEYNFF